MNVHDDPREDKPLDPAVERLRRKMVRLMVVSIGIMMVGLMAVLGAIVYKASGGGGAREANVSLSARSSGAPAGPGIEGRIELPAGSRIVSSALDGNNILLHVRSTDGEVRLLIYAVGEDRIIATVKVD
ncbi:MAG: hypothetical protein VYD64_04060 [Pseudomonadota bacterium]|nr:hypothetical protein [Pseudomonadota bacterium]